MPQDLDRLENALSQNLRDKFKRTDVVPTVEVTDTPVESYSGVKDIDLESSTIVINNWAIDDIDGSVDLWSDLMAEEALDQLIDLFVGNLEDNIGHEVQRPVNGMFLDLGKNVGGSYNNQEREIYCNYDMIGGLEPDTVPMRISNSLGGTVKHESVHAFEKGLGKFKGLSGLIEFKTDTDREYTLHPDRAGIEALAKYREDPSGLFKDASNALKHNMLDPWKVPGIMARDGDKEESNRSRMNGGGGYKMNEHLYDLPYDQAEVIAFTVDHHLSNTEEHPIDETERVLFELEADAEDWQEMISSIWRDYDVPDYHKLFSENYARIRNDSSYAKKEFNRLFRELEEIDESDAELYNQGKSYVHAYRESGREIPNNLEILDDKLENMRKSRV